MAESLTNRRLIAGLATVALLTAACGGSDNPGPSLTLTGSNPAKANGASRTITPQLTFGAKLDPASVPPRPSLFPARRAFSPSPLPHPATLSISRQAPCCYPAPGHRDIPRRMVGPRPR